MGSECQVWWNAERPAPYVFRLFSCTLHLFCRTFDPLAKTGASSDAQAYLLFEIPSNMLLARSRPSIFLPALMVTWVGHLIPCPK